MSCWLGGPGCASPCMAPHLCSTTSTSHQQQFTHSLQLYQHSCLHCQVPCALPGICVFSVGRHIPGGGFGLAILH